MKTFDSVAEFINYYNNKQTIPTSFSITLNGNEHTFRRTSTHNNDSIGKRMFDRYNFVEEEFYGLGIELSINYYRYFELKVILEAYFSFYHDKDADFEQYKDAVSNSLEKWTGLRWVNINQVSNAFKDFRQNAYMNARKDLAYDLPFHIYDADDDGLFTNFIDLKRKDKWEIDEEGKSHYFSGLFEIPDYW